MKWSQFDKDIIADVYQSGELRELMMNSEEDLSQRMIFSKILTDQTTSNDETEIHIPNAMVVGMRHYGNEQLPIGETYQLEVEPDNTEDPNAVAIRDLQVFIPKTCLPQWRLGRTNTTDPQARNKDNNYCSTPCKLYHR